jgi:23S rRNA G2069 N7-methylase RlmK/C1962 C5-methylase RlmI
MQESWLRSLAAMMVLIWLRAARPFAVQSLRRRGMAVGAPRRAQWSASSTASTSAGLGGALPTVVLEKGKARLFQDGNPIIYGGAVKAVEGKPEPGGEVAVTDHMGNSIGRGIFNPHSTYRVRMLSRAYESVHTLPLLDLLKARIEQAVALRASIGLPSKTNSVYRLINGEGDRLGGLVVDVFDKVVVAQSSAFWVEVHKARIEEALLATLPGAGGKKKPVVLWRRAESRLKQDGWTGDMSDDQVPDSLRGAILQVKENGLKFAVSPESGQKTGFYADQRANRLALRAACTSRSMRASARSRTLRWCVRRF